MVCDDFQYQKVELLVQVTSKSLTLCELIRDQVLTVVIADVLCLSSSPAGVMNDAAHSKLYKDERSDSHRCPP